MKKFLSFIIASGFIFIYAQFACAGGAVAKRQQMQKLQMQKQQQQQQQQIMIQQMQQQRMMQGRQQAVSREDVQDIVDFPTLVNALGQNSRPWTLIIDRSAKEMVVSYYIHQFRQQGILIQNPPGFYVDMIDVMSQDSPDMLAQPFDLVLKVVSIVEYDFDNGQNKDALALAILGSPEAVAANKQRLGIIK